MDFYEDAIRNMLSNKKAADLGYLYGYTTNNDTDELILNNVIKECKQNNIPIEQINELSQAYANKYDVEMRIFSSLHTSYTKYLSWLNSN